MNESSKDLFRELDYYHRKILERLAFFGPMNLVDLGRKKRWQMKLRLYGSNKTLGLIPNEFVQELKITKDRVKYDLTVKGLLAVLAVKNFDNIDIVKKYKEFLIVKLEKKELVNLFFEFIKYEIALILYYNHNQGLNWTKFKNIKQYWADYKTFSDHVKKTFFLSEFLDKDVSEEYKRIESQYLTLYNIVEFCSSTIRKGNGMKYLDLDQFLDDETFNLYVHHWYLFIDDQNMREKDMDTLHLDWISRKENNPLDIYFFYNSKLDAYKTKSQDILRRNGYEIVKSKTGPYSI